MKSFLKIALAVLFIHLFQLSSAQQILSKLEVQHVERILNTLASDEMKGRSALSKDIEKSADFIASEMKRINLTPYVDSSFRQTFEMNKVSTTFTKATINGAEVSPENIIALGSDSSLIWDEKSTVKIAQIKAGEDLSSSFRSYAKSKENTIVFVDSSFQKYFSRFHQMLSAPRFSKKEEVSNNSIVYILTAESPKSFDITIEKKVEVLSLSNIAGIIPGKSKADEFVIFSGHYDHIGIITAVDQDSIANGADDDASGISAMLALAEYYKKKNNNERTLIFVAFTAEEVGGFGSQYFSSRINPDKVTAMINIEMIGKDSKFGPKSLYITGYDFSNLGELMQKNLKNTPFTFHPDPYTKQNLFYRSDNAVLAAQGVPAHSFSTSQMDKDEYYHTVKDEVKTLDIKNIISSIEAIALGASGIVEGKQTPSRVEKLKD